MGNCTGKQKQKQAADARPTQAETRTNDTSLPHTNAFVSTGTKSRPPLPTVPQDAPPKSPTAGVRLYVALFDYDARTAEDLTFKKGDYLEVKPENTAFDWWHAKSRSSGKEGYIPSNYVAEVKTLEAEE